MLEVDCQPPELHIPRLGLARKGFIYEIRVVSVCIADLSGRQPWVDL